MAIKKIKKQVKSKSKDQEPPKGSPVQSKTYFVTYSFEDKSRKVPVVVTESDYFKVPGTVEDNLDFVKSEVLSRISTKMGFESDGKSSVDIDTEKTYELGDNLDIPYIPEKWQKTITCESCYHEYTITTIDIRYGNLGDPEALRPDMQFYINCPQCKKCIVLNDIPSRVALWVQTKINL